MQKNFVIAGGSKGIGRQLVRQLQSEETTIYVYSRTPGDLETTDRMIYQQHDFSSGEFGGDLPERIHGAAYCPGTINLRSFRSMKPEDFRNDIEINLIGAVKFLQACLNGLKKGAESQTTSVVLFSTVAVSTGMPMHASVAAAKGAVEGLTRSLAAEWAPNIRVNCLAPALTHTPLTERFFSSPEKTEALAAKYPLRRTGEPADLASLACFLMKEESSWITGQVIGVDGGMSTIGN